jgi:DNA-binding MarR family transcriptional regulator
MGLTAARFDLLYVLLKHASPVGQRSIHRALGVTPPVVSRMLKSLRLLDLVKRERRPLDSREWLVSLTRHGRSVIRAAVHEFISRRRAERIVAEGLCPNIPAGLQRTNLAFVRMHALESLLDDLRAGFHAGGTLYCPWHPDD